MATDDVATLGVIDVAANITRGDANCPTQGEEQVGVVLAHALGLGEELLSGGADVRSPRDVATGGVDEFHQP